MKKIILSILIILFKNLKNPSIRSRILKVILKYDNSNMTISRTIMKDFYDITIGKKSYGCFKIDSTIEPGTVIGSYCSFAPGVIIGGMNHPLHFVSTHPFLYNKSYNFIKETNFKVIEDGTKKVIIEDDVWLGRNVIINSGVTIGKGAVVAAGSVVTKSVNPYAIVGGVPAKFIKSRFSDIQTDQLKRIDWEKWDEKEIIEKIDSFYNIERFLDENKIN